MAQPVWLSPNAINTHRSQAGQPSYRASIETSHLSRPHRDSHWWPLFLLHRLEPDCLWVPRSQGQGGRRHDPPDRPPVPLPCVHFLLWSWCCFSRCHVLSWLFHPVSKFHVCSEYLPAFLQTKCKSSLLTSHNLSFFVSSLPLHSLCYWILSVILYIVWQAEMLMVSLESSQIQNFLKTSQMS